MSRKLDNYISLNLVNMHKKSGQVSMHGGGTDKKKYQKLSSSGEAHTNDWI